MKRKRNKYPKVSVVIPAFNEEKILPFCLDSLVSQKTQYSFEVILVDNNSTDNTRKIALKFKNRLNLKIISEHKQGRGAARRTGFSEAKGEYIFSTDADAKLPPFWLDRLAGEFVDNTVAVTGSSYVNDCSWFSNILINSFHPFVIYGYRLIFSHYWISGYNTAIRKSAYQKTKGFNADLNSMEDADIGFKLNNIGRIKFIDFPIDFSGRRFKGGVFSGTVSYFPSFINYFLGRGEIELTSIR